MQFTRSSTGLVFLALMSGFVQVTDANDASVAPASTPIVVIDDQYCGSWWELPTASDLIVKICRTTYFNTVNDHAIGGTSIRMFIKNAPKEGHEPKPHRIHKIELFVYPNPKKEVLLEQLTCEMGAWLTPAQTMSCVVNSREPINAYMQFAVHHDGFHSP